MLFVAVTDWYFCPLLDRKIKGPIPWQPSRLDRKRVPASTCHTLSSNCRQKLVQLENQLLCLFIFASVFLTAWCDTGHVDCQMYINFPEAMIMAMVMHCDAQVFFPLHKFISCLSSSLKLYRV